MKAGKTVAFVLWLKCIHYVLYSVCCLEQVFEQVENENKVITARSWQWLSVPCVWKKIIT